MKNKLFRAEISRCTAGNRGRIDKETLFGKSFQLRPSTQSIRSPRSRSRRLHFFSECHVKRVLRRKQIHVGIGRHRQHGKKVCLFIIIAVDAPAPGSGVFKV